MGTRKTAVTSHYTTKSSDETLALLEKIIGGPLTFAKMLWAWRQCEEMTQEQFARKLAVSKQHLCDLEKGRKFASPARAAQFAKLLGLPPDLAVQLTLQDLVRREGLKYQINVVGF